MAFSPPATGSIAARPTIKKGGVRSVDEDPGAFSQRMAARQASNPATAAGGQPGGVTPPSRRDNIVAARADGTFDTKRNNFNADTAQHGQTMDEAGNITGSAAPKPAGSLVPGRSAGSSVWKPNTPAPATGASPPPTAAPAAAAPPPGPTATAMAPAPQGAGLSKSPPASVTPPPPAAPPPPAVTPPKPAAPPPAVPMARPPAAPTAPPTSTPYAQAAINRSTTAIAPPPPRPAVAAAAPPAAAAARKPGMINDGQGFKPAALRTAQDFPASVTPPKLAQPAAAPNPSLIGPPPPPGSIVSTRGKTLIDPAPGQTSQQLGQQIEAKRALFQKNRKDLAAIQTKKQASHNATAAASAPAPKPLTAVESLAEQIRPGAVNETRARAAGTPQAITPGHVPLSNAAGKTGSLLAKITAPKPKFALPKASLMATPKGPPQIPVASVLNRPSTFRPSPPPYKGSPNPRYVVGR